MNRYQSLTAHAISIIITGFVLVVLSYMPSGAIQYIVAAGMILSGIFALITAYKSWKYKDTLKYHILHAISMCGFGFGILFYANNVEMFFRISEFFFLFYGITELVFCAYLIAIKKRVIYKIIATKMIIGFSIIIGAVMIWGMVSVNRFQALTICGITMILSGIITIVFEKDIRKLHTETDYTT
jgi:predicted phage tail protein